jgi:tetratricopeptide (TPR) repeat protein
MAPAEGHAGDVGLFAGRYRIERELGRGGMAVVHLAHDTKHDRLVALKVLRREIAAVLGGDRFLREIEVAARLNHPNILPLYDSGHEGGQLHYVMPYVEGGTLRDRLARGPRLTVEEAVEIARQTAAGLTHAHALGVVHRDIKPANLLLSGPHVFIADFGIARAIYQAATADQLTETGLIIGTPLYMAPEQIRGASKVDGRADVYSLASVLYEMLAGEAPRTDSHRPGAIHSALKAAGRPVPAAVEAALTRALAIDPDDRFTTAAELVAALDQARPGLATEVGRAIRRSRPRDLLMLGLVPVIVAVAIWLGGKLTGSGNVAITPDTTRYAVLPFEHAAGTPGGLDEEERVRAGLRRWGGVEPADPVRIREEVARYSAGQISSREAIAISRALNAGRYVRGTVAPAGDSLLVRGALYQVELQGDRLLTEHTVALRQDLQGADSAFQRLVDWLLFRGEPPTSDGTGVGTRSLFAWQSAAAGKSALRAWQLPLADTMLAQATRIDPEYAEAWLWLALTRAWGDAEPARWRTAAEQAALRRVRLPARYQAMSDAALAQAHGDLAEACPKWSALTAREPEEFAVWYGTAYCLAQDQAVVRDSRSPSGWRFRTSYHQALTAYRRAFALQPGVLASFQAQAFRSFRQLLKTTSSDLRPGTAVPPDTNRFGASASLAGDTLAFVPYPLNAFVTGNVARDRSGTLRVLDHQRRLFREIAMGWATAAPGDPGALEALAIALDLLGDRAAIDTLQHARRLARDHASRVRLAVAEVWSLLQFSLPDDLKSVERAGRLADSLLAAEAPDTTPDPAGLASLAALTGRASLSAAHYRRAASQPDIGVLPAIARTAPALLVYAAMGGPTDSLALLEDALESAIEERVEPSARADMRAVWLERAASLAFPSRAFRLLAGMRASEDPLLRGQSALSAGDTAGAIRSLEQLRSIRRNVLPENVTFDALYPEARLLDQAGDRTGAAAWLDPTLRALGVVPLGLNIDPARAAGLVRAMGLRAEIADSHGDRTTAARWARCVLVLWSGADGFLKPYVNRLAAIAAR